MDKKISDIMLEIGKDVSARTGDMRAEILALCMKVSEVTSDLSDKIVANMEYKNDVLFHDILDSMNSYIAYIESVITKIKEG